MPAVSGADREEGVTPHGDVLNARALSAKRAGGFDSRSLAEIVVKDRVRIPDCGAGHLASALGVESGLTARKDGHQCND